MVKTWRAALAEHQGVMSHVQELLAVHFEPAVSMLESSIRSGKKILLCGNGGSAAHALHFAAELTVRYKTDRPPIAAVALGADVAGLSAAANDYAWADVFRRQVEALGAPGDTLVAFSTSGTSVNIVNAVMEASHRGMTTLGFSGLKGLKNGADVDLNVPSIEVPRIQEAHTFIIHALCEELDHRGANASRASHFSPLEPA